MKKVLEKPKLKTKSKGGKMENKILTTVAEIKVSYSTNVPPSDLYHITSNRDSFEVLSKLYDKDLIEYKESFYVLYLNRSNNVLGYSLVSTGGSYGTVVDGKQLLAIALKCNACGIILSHNHPSGNLKPSNEDIELTKSLKKGAKYLGINVLDHIIVSPFGTYLSFATEGIL